MTTITRITRNGIAAALALAVCGVASVASAQLGTPSATPLPAPMPPQRAMQPVAVSSEELPAVTIYQEYEVRSSHVKREFAPAYTPHATSLHVNPRTYPNALGVMATPYFQYLDIPGTYFTQPLNYTSIAPPNSAALAYFQGNKQITSELSRGLPKGRRVVEPVIVPYTQSAKTSGIYIEAGSDPLAVGTPVAFDSSWPSNSMLPPVGACVPGVGCPPTAHPGSPCAPNGSGPSAVPCAPPVQRTIEK